jgi:hypothetical protein
MYRIYLGEASGIQAGFDYFLNGSSFLLIDWADRIELDTSVEQSAKNVALGFYRNRCEPDIKIKHARDYARLNLENVVYGMAYIEYEGESSESIVLVKEQELTD